MPSPTPTLKEIHTHAARASALLGDWLTELESAPRDPIFFSQNVNSLTQAVGMLHRLTAIEKTILAFRQQDTGDLRLLKEFNFLLDKITRIYHDRPITNKRTPAITTQAALKAAPLPNPIPHKLPPTWSEPSLLNEIQCPSLPGAAGKSSADIPVCTETTPNLQTTIAESPSDTATPGCAPQSGSGVPPLSAHQSPQASNNYATPLQCNADIPVCDPQPHTHQSPSTLNEQPSITSCGTAAPGCDGNQNNVGPADTTQSPDRDDRLQPTTLVVGSQRGETATTGGSAAALASLDANPINVGSADTTSQPQPATRNPPPAPSPLTRPKMLAMVRACQLPTGWRDPSLRDHLLHYFNAVLLQFCDHWEQRQLTQATARTQAENSRPENPITADAPSDAPANVPPSPHNNRAQVSDEIPESQPQHATRNPQPDFPFPYSHAPPLAAVA